MRLRSYNEAIRLARAAGEDAANRRMRKAGRRAWSETDLEHAARVSNTLLTDLGMDIEGWIVLAGLPRNEPEDPVKPMRARRPRRTPEPVQLAFAFV